MNPFFHFFTSTFDVARSRFNVLSLYLLLLLGAPALLAQQNGIAQDSEIVIVPTGDNLFQWFGKSGRSYFIQVSDTNTPLAKWHWTPFIESGIDELISHEVGATTGRAFFRLLHTTLPQQPGVSLEDWDADGDHLNNWTEITTHGSNPLKPDTDDDGLPDDWEVAHNLNVLDNGTEDPDRGPDAPFGSQSMILQSSSLMTTATTVTTNSQAFAAGVKAAGGATMSDKDGDLISDQEDADPLSPAVNWRKSPKPVYAVIPVPGWVPATHSFPVRLTNHNDILTNRAVYKNGLWRPINANYLGMGQGSALSYQFEVNGRRHSCHLGQCQSFSMNDQGDIMGNGKILIDPVIEVNPVTGEEVSYDAGHTPSFALIWRSPEALPEILGVAPGTIIQGARHAQFGMLHRDGTVLLGKAGPEDALLNGNAFLERLPNAANGWGVQTSPLFTAPSFTYPAMGGNTSFRSYLPTGVIQSWVWPATGGPKTLYTETISAPGAPGLNFQSSPSTIGTAPGGEACINLSGQVLVGHSGRYHQVPSLEGATKISPHGAALMSGPPGNPNLWYGGSIYSLSSCVSNPQALGSTLTVTDINDGGSILAIVDASTASQKLVILLPVEVVDKDKNPISKLKVGKMFETGVLSGTGASAVLDIEKDSDRFFVRVKGGAAMGGISVKVSTTDNPDAADYNDNATQIDLVADGADAISKSMLLVSDEVDDDHPVDSIADDVPGDRTHKIQLGGNFKIEEIKIGTGAWQALGTKVSVPFEKTVNVKLANCQYGFPGFRGPSWNPAEITFLKAVLKERYAQTGIKLTFSEVAGPWISLDGWLDEGEYPTEVVAGSLEIPQVTKDIIDDGPVISQNEVAMYLVIRLDRAAFGHFAEVAIPPKYLSVANRKYGNKILRGCLKNI